MKFTIFTALFGFLLIGCSGSSSEDKKDVLDIDDPYGINGVWTTDCFEFSENLFYIRSYEFVVDLWLGSLEKYENDSSCSEPTQPTIVFSGSFYLGESTITESGVTAKELDLFILNANGEETYLIAYDLIKKDETQFVLSDSLSFSQRSTKLNFDVIYYKQ
ncbi:MAG: hypothetical protein ACI9T9_001516 [Oleiphilaceae bacterium]|jgi:hypothetical protein